MMELKKWLQSQGENKRAFYIFTILSLVLCFFLIVNACYVICKCQVFLGNSFDCR